MKSNFVNLFKYITTTNYMTFYLQNSKNLKSKALFCVSYWKPNKPTNKIIFFVQSYFSIGMLEFSIKGANCMHIFFYSYCSKRNPNWYKRFAIKKAGVVFDRYALTYNEAIG